MPRVPAAAQRPPLVRSRLPRLRAENALVEWIEGQHHELPYAEEADTRDREPEGGVGLVADDGDDDSGRDRERDEDRHEVPIPAEDRLLRREALVRRNLAERRVNDAPVAEVVPRQDTDEDQVRELGCLDP